MGNNKSQESKSTNVESTNLNNNINTTIHFENIYNLHDSHKQQLKELHRNINFGLWSIFGLIFAIIIIVVGVYVGRKMLKARKAKVQQKIEEKAKALAMEMLEKGDVK